MQSSSQPKQQQKSPTPKHPSGQQHRMAAANAANSKWLPHEERLRRTWRRVGTTVVNCISKAEAAASSQTQPSGSEETKKRDLDEAVILFLRTRTEFHRLLSHTEAKLQGKDEEMVSLETYVRTQSRLGKRKRKR